MMVAFGNLAKLAQIEQPRKLVEMKHRLVFTMLAEKRDVLAEIHIFEIIRNITTVAALHALAEFLYYFLVRFRHIAIVSETAEKCKASVGCNFKFQTSNFKLNWRFACKSFRDVRRI